MSSLSDIQHPQALEARTSRLEIFGISWLVATRVSIEPDQIETFETVVKYDVGDRDRIAALYAALERAKPAPSKVSVEYRWKVVAYDAEGARIAEVYASAISRYGMTGDKTKFEFANDEFTKHLETHFAVTPTLEELGLSS